MTSDVPTPRQAIDASFALGDDETRRILGGVGLSSASPARLRALVAAAKGVPIITIDGPRVTAGA
jgi:hypothetical protein